MTTEPAFRAPWSKALILISIAVTALCFTCALIPLLAHPDGVSISVAVLLLALWVGAALFTVRGFVLSRDALLVQRLLWRTALPLEGLIGAAADPAAMRGVNRLAGNGGLFSFSGLWTNRRLGRFRAFATAPRLAVVLEFPKQKVVVTPENPGAFLDTLRLRFPNAKVKWRLATRSRGDRTSARLLPVT
jgi:hypothetical protein